MGVLPSDVGPEAVVRLQTGGLTAAEVVYRDRLSIAKTAKSLSSRNQASSKITIDKSAIAEIFVSNNFEAIGQT